MPGAGHTAFELVEQLGSSDGSARHAAYEALLELGRPALTAIHRGLEHDNWQVRRWCAMSLDRMADPESLERLVPLLGDSHSLVRLWAVHSIACDQCKGEGINNPVDVVSLLVDRLDNDSSIRVRRMAAAMLANHYPGPRVYPAFRKVLEKEADRKLRLHATHGLARSVASEVCEVAASD